MSANDDLKDMSDTATPNSTRLTADALVSGPRVIKVTAVERYTTEKGLPAFTLYFEGDNGRPWKPCTNMRRLILSEDGWGKDATQWPGRYIKIWRNPEVQYSDKEVGGIELTHLSHIKREYTILLQVRRNKRRAFTVRPLVLEDEGITDPVEQAKKALKSAADVSTAMLSQTWRSLPQAVRDAISTGGCPQDLKTRAAAADKARKDAEAVANPNAATHAALTALAAATPAPVDAPASAPTAPATGSGGNVDPVRDAGADPLADVTL